MSKVSHSLYYFLSIVLTDRQLKIYHPAWALHQITVYFILTEDNQICTLYVNVLG